MSNNSQQKIIAACSNASMHNKISINDVVQKTGLSQEVVIKESNALVDQGQLQAAPRQMLLFMLDGMKLENINMKILYM